MQPFWQCPRQIPRTPGGISELRALKSGGDNLVSESIQWPLRLTLKSHAIGRLRVQAPATKLRPPAADACANADTENRSRLLTALWLAPARLPVLLLPITGIAATVALLPIGSSSHDMVTYFLPGWTPFRTAG